MRACPPAGWQSSFWAGTNGTGEAGMGRGVYEDYMRQRLRDLDVMIASARSRLAETPDDALAADLSRPLAQLERDEAVLRDKLDALAAEPDATWEDLRLEIEDEWDALIQDFEERLASLA